MADQCVLCGFVPADMAQLQAAVKALQEGGVSKAAPADPEANVGGGGGGGNASAVKSWHKMVDGNGLALMCFGFSTFMFFAFLCNIDGTGAKKEGDIVKNDINFGVFFLCDMLQWGVCLGLVTAGLVQGLQGDHLGFTSYVYHAAILGSIGFQFESMLQGAAGSPYSTYMISYMLYASFWHNLVFTIMAFRAATVFGILYFFVAVMFLMVAMNFSQLLDDSANKPDIAGARIAGAWCGIVAFSCAGLLIPVMTGLGAAQVFGLPNPIGAALGPAPGGGDAPAEDGVIEPQTKIKLVDANGLALSAFGFSTWMFFAFLNNLQGLNWGDLKEPKDPKKNHPGLGHLQGMLYWGVPCCLVTAGIFQFANGDHLGFTSYIFHATILGTTGWWIEDALGEDTYKTGNLYIFSYYYYAAAWFNMVFTIMAFRLAKMFGVLYFTVGLMFFLVGLDWSQKMTDIKKTGVDTDMTGHHIAGFSCLLVALQCFYLFLPVMTGKGIIV